MKMFIVTNHLSEVEDIKLLQKHKNFQMTFISVERNSC